MLRVDFSLLVARLSQDRLATFPPLTGVLRVTTVDLAWKMYTE